LFYFGVFILCGSLLFDNGKMALDAKLFKEAVTFYATIPPLKIFSSFEE
jgi:hypothetical protein